MRKVMSPVLLRTIFSVFSILFILSLFTACQRTQPQTAIILSPPRDTGERVFPERWVSAAELQDLINEENVVVVDFSENPSQVIPGAIWIDRMTLVRNFEGNIFDIEAMTVHEAILGAHGIDNSTIVIAYCDNNSLWASRMIWNLLAYGHKDGRILEGGTRAWIAAGGTVSDRPGTPRERREYVARMNVGSVRADFRDVRAAQSNPDWVIIDVRTQGEWDAGHIGGALPFRYPDDFLDLSTGLLLSRSYYEELFRDIPRDAKLVVHCSGGTRTSVVYFIFKDIMGWSERVLNYNGSFPNWVWAGGEVET